MLDLSSHTHPFIFKPAAHEDSIALQIYIYGVNSGEINVYNVKSGEIKTYNVNLGEIRAYDFGVR